MLPYNLTYSSPAILTNNLQTILLELTYLHKKYFLSYRQAVCHRLAVK